MGCSITKIVGRERRNIEKQIDCVSDVEGQVYVKTSSCWMIERIE